MIVIESIRLRNFRAIREAFFEPKLDGITGIFGPNGAGKTTFLSGALFALFGELPPNSTKASLRRLHSGKDECSTSVLFTHLDQQVEVIREIKGNNNTVTVDIYVDGIPQTVTSVGAADKWISQRLGLDVTGFLTAFIVRQKELDQLVNATPAVRKQIIERLAGIEAINEALKKARKDESIAKEVLSSLPGSESQVSTAESQILLLNNKVEELNGIKSEVQQRLLDSQNKQKTLSNQLDQLRDQESSLFRAQTLVESLVNENTSLSARVEKLNYVVDIKSDFDIEELRSQHKAITAAIAEKNNALNSAKVEEAGVSAKIQELKDSILPLETLISNSDTDISKEHDLNVQKSELAGENEKLTDERASALGRREDLLTSIETLQHNTDCPTCHTHLDDPKALIESLNSMATNFAHTAEQAREKINANKVLIAQTEASIREIATLVEANKRLLTLKEQLEVAVTKRDNLPDLSNYKDELEQLSVDKDNIAEIGVKAKNILDDRLEYNNAVSKLSSNEGLINENQRTLIELRKTFSTEKINAIRGELSRVQRETELINGQVNESFSELSSYESRLSIANNNYRSSVEQWKRKKELLQAQEQKALTTELIEKFRKESVASLTPELSEYATELISDITNGAYTEIRLDDDFKITVVNANGDERSVGWLSGGEESAVAFALRLAIAFLITGGAPDLLWLDEPLTAQDQDRRTAMLSTIRNLPIKQIIMINHAQEAGDIADKAVTVIPDLTHGSILEIDERQDPQNLLD